MNIFAGTANSVFRSTDYGESWATASAGLGNRAVISFVVSGTDLFAGTTAGVFRSTDNGTSWTTSSTGLTNHWVGAFAVSGTNLFAGTDIGVFRSTDSGATWMDASSGLPEYTGVDALASSGAYLFAGMSRGGVFLSTNGGTMWTDVNSGLTDSWITSLAVSGAYLFAGTDVTGVWERPLSAMTASVDVSQSVASAVFHLAQNYPNPFNPTTSIRYALPRRSHVTLAVYSTLGQQVATLVSETQDGGYHEVWFDGSGLASGVYFYRIVAGTFVETKRLLILR
jgi:hypothetical protein